VPAEVAIRQVEPSLQVGELGTAGFGPRALELRVTAERTRDLRITSGSLCARWSTRCPPCCVNGAADRGFLLAVHGGSGTPGGHRAIRRRSHPIGRLSYARSMVAAVYIGAGVPVPARSRLAAYLGAGIVHLDG
jgi:hypothetical protein